jgi:lipid II:glycine glycyltransferase (peptidoglycan interpeptide bridge formation enzyme)
MDESMLKVSYRVKGLALNELWFASKVPVNKLSLFAFYCYRDSAVKSAFFLKKEIKHTLINDLRLEENELFSDFKSNVRNEIRKCEKIEDFTYNFNSSNKELFFAFYTNFAKAKNLATLEKRSLEKYGENLFYISAYLEGQLTNMQVYVMDKESGTVRLLHSISTLYAEDDKHKKAQIGWINRYLHWQMMLRFKALAFKTFDWGGYTNNPNSALAGIDKFKASFGGKKIELYNYYTLPYYVVKLIQGRLL